MRAALLLLGAVAAEGFYLRGTAARKRRMEEMMGPGDNDDVQKPLSSPEKPDVIAKEVLDLRKDHSPEAILQQQRLIMEIATKTMAVQQLNMQKPGIGTMLSAAFAGLVASVPFAHGSERVDYLLKNHKKNAPQIAPKTYVQETLRTHGITTLNKGMTVAFANVVPTALAFSLFLADKRRAEETGQTGMTDAFRSRFIYNVVKMPFDATKTHAFSTQTEEKAPGLPEWSTAAKEWWSDKTPQQKARMMFGPMIVDMTMYMIFWKMNTTVQDHLPDGANKPLWLAFAGGFCAGWASFITAPLEMVRLMHNDNMALHEKPDMTEEEKRNLKATRQVVLRQYQTNGMWPFFTDPTMLLRGAKNMSTMFVFAYIYNRQLLTSTPAIEHLQA